MKKRMTMALFAGALMAAMLPGAVAAQTQNVSLLFVVSTDSGNVEGDTLTLDAVPAVLWFTDRPDRGAGHIEPSALAALWTEGEDSFADDPPNAVVSLLDEDTIVDAVIELTGIVSKTDIAGAGDDMAFTFELLDGELPQGAIGTASLFIDSFATFDEDYNNVSTGIGNEGNHIVMVDMVGPGRAIGPGVDS